MMTCCAAAVAVVACSEQNGDVRQEYTAEEIRQTAKLENREVADLMEKHSIDRIEEIAGDGEETMVRMLSNNGEEQAVVSIHYSDDGEETIRLDGFGKDFSVTIGQKRLKYTNHINGMVGAITPSPEHARLASDEEATKIQDDVGEDLLKLAAGISSVLNMTSSVATPQGGVSVGHGTSSNELVACYGRIVGSGSFSRSKMWCCGNAYYYNANKCTNSYCYGCCSHLGCDSYCQLGDFYCYCYAESRACSYH